MGTWRIESYLYGERERWIPDFIGDWPADENPLTHTTTRIIPDPCPVCDGELTRRTVTPTALRLRWEYTRALSDWQTAMGAGASPPKPVPGIPVQIVLYDLACYAKRHRWAPPKHTGDDAKRPPVEIGELVPAVRTSDWR